MRASEPAGTAAAPFLVRPAVLYRVLAAMALFVAAMVAVRALVPRAPARAEVLGVEGVSTLDVGGELEAPAGGAALVLERARVDVDPGARVRLASAGEALEVVLLRGGVRASGARLRLATAAGARVVLAGAGSLALEDGGGARLAVQEGDASLVAERGAARVPAGYAARARPGRTPDVPLAAACPEALELLVRRVERASDASESDAAEIARIEDRVVLLNLAGAPAPRVRESARAALLARASAPPAGDPALALADDAAWRAWSAALDLAR